MKTQLLKNFLMGIALLAVSFGFAQEPIITIIDVQQIGTIPVDPLSTATFEITYKTDGTGPDILDNTWRMYQGGAVSPGFVKLVYVQTNGAEATIQISFDWPAGFTSNTNYEIRLFNAAPKTDFDWAPLAEHHIGKAKDTQNTPFVPETDWLELGDITVDVTAPPVPNSEFIQDPSFEVLGLANYNGTGGGGGVSTRSIETTPANVDDGAQSLANTWTGNAEDRTGGPTPYWNFGQYVHEYATSVITSSTVVTVTMRVKSTRSTQARIIARIRTRNVSSVNLNKPSFPSDTQLTSGTADTWETLTFSLPIGELSATTGGAIEEVREMTFWFGVDYDVDPLNEALNANTGDIFYFDNMTAALGTLSVKGNTLEGVSVYPNPARDVLTLKTPRGGDISIYNILGAQVKSDKTVLKDYRMNVSDLKSGIYLLRVNSEGKQFTQKLVIQ